MPSPKDGSPGSIVAPTAPTAPEEADNADPGQMEEVKQQQRQAGTGKYGSTPAPKREHQEGEPKKPHYIEVELVDEEGNPVPGQVVEIKDSSGYSTRRTTDNKGCVRVEYLEAGNCDITFPNLDEEAWKPA